MKKGFIVSLIAIIAFCSSSVVFAEVTSVAGRNKYHAHTHEYADQHTKYVDAWGAELDVVVYKDVLAGIPYAIGTRTEYDFGNNVWGAFAKVSLDLSGLTKKVLGIK